MAIKQRIIKNLTLAENNLNSAINANDNINFEKALNNLIQAKNLCQNGLTKTNYNPYNEIYKGLILAFKNLIEIGAQEEILNLSLEFLSYLKKQTHEEKNFKKEIVFLPIQAAMWDSLESVWKEAFEDTEHCIVYVIPLPYANLNKDGSVNKWRCEINEYPEYVPVTFYKDIDLNEMHPDIIFINNPYDDLNYITRVNKTYYSQNLKKCCDKLIYIPYFILNEPVTENSLEHFVLTGGVVYSDIVVLQSETLKEQYINILIRESPWKDRAYWEKRIIAAGSPKIDKVMYSKKEDFAIPKKWQNLIEGKKVILYITSFASQIDNADKIIDKMNYVFNIFKNRKDVVLWWRPHPLLKASMHSMLPIIEEAYTSLEQKYIKEEWGIYDDTGDLHRAICYSDAYYGDFSSVTTLYKYTNKPIMIQNMTCV